MQNQAMEITAGRAIVMRHRAILGDFTSADSQIAMETSIHEHPIVLHDETIWKPESRSVTRKLFKTAAPVKAHDHQELAEF